MLGRIHSIETMGMLDGPGIRTIFFLQGCPLKCLYCHNPDSQKYYTKLQMTAEEVVDMSLKYKAYYDVSGGGVTFSGGEPLVQGAFLVKAIKALKEHGIHVAIDTSGYGNKTYFDEVISLADMILLDIKHFDEHKHKHMTGVSMKDQNIFLNKLSSYKGKLWVRHVMVPGYTDNLNSMDSLFKRVKPFAQCIEKIEILPFHQLAIDKYDDLGLDYTLKGVPEMNIDKAKEFEHYINDKFKQYITERVGEKHYLLSQTSNKLYSV